MNNKKKSSFYVTRYEDSLKKIKKLIKENKELRKHIEQLELIIEGI